MVADPLPHTLLSLPRYAKIMGINPVHFQGAFGQTVWPVDSNSCQDLWPRHSWQDADHISKEDLVYAIKSAEDDIASILGYYPAPVWVSREVKQYPQFYRPEYQGSGGRNFMLSNNGSHLFPNTGGNAHRKGMQTNWGKVLAGGRRNVELVGTATVAGGELVYSDTDSDTFFETATITLPTNLEDICEIKVYIAGKGGDQRWEIRPVRSKAFSGANVVIVLDSWLLTDPDKQAAFPTDAGYSGLDIQTNTSNFVQSIDVYREYNDTTQASVHFFWESTDCSTCPGCTVNLENGGFIILESAGTGTTCPACGLVSQTGCLTLRNFESGLVVPAPGAYDADAGTFVVNAFAVCRDPDLAQFWYYAGDMDEHFLRDVSCDPLSNFYAQAIAWMATARLERPFCACSNALALAQRLMTDIAFTGNDTSFLVDFEMLKNPFGTRVGEIQAWNRVSKMKKKLFTFATI